MEEVWKPIKEFNMFNYDGGWRYEVSNIGRVRRAGYWGYKHRKYYQPRMMRQHEDRGGRWKVTLQAEGVAHTCRVHRLVASAFIARPVFATQVIHMDGDVKNNVVENLAWATSTSTTPYVANRAKAVRQYTVEGVLLAEYPSASTAQRVTGFDHSSISACCHRKKKRGTCHGFIWRFIDDDEMMLRGGESVGRSVETGNSL